MLLGEDDLYYHDRVRRILAEAGFTLWRIERDEVHPVWVVWIRPGKIQLSKDKTEASRQLQKILKRAGLKIKPDELRVFDQRKNMIRFTFMFPWGCAGVLTQDPQA